MDNSKVCSLLSQVHSRLIDIPSLDCDQEEILIQGRYTDISRLDLEHLVSLLYLEHSKIIKLSLDISNLLSSLKEFGFFFDNELDN